MAYMEAGGQGYSCTICFFSSSAAFHLPPSLYFLLELLGERDW